MALVTVPAPTALLAGAHESAQTASKPWTIQALMPSSETSGRAGHGDIVRCVEWDAAVSSTPKCRAFSSFFGPPFS